MIVGEQVTINGSKAAIWAAITNIENASKIISGILNIEVVEKPANGLVGLKWRETRMFFGKPATVEKWITDAAENDFYKTRAEDGGFVFLTTKSISESSGGMTVLGKQHASPRLVPTGERCVRPTGTRHRRFRRPVGPVGYRTSLEPHGEHHAR